jgi:hypothetical protein
MSFQPLLIFEHSVTDFAAKRFLFSKHDEA